jgi:hypothetical protein
MSLVEEKTYPFTDSTYCQIQIFNFPLVHIALGPQSIYRGRVEIGGVYLPSQLEHTPQLCT